MAESVTVVGIQFKTFKDAQVSKAFKKLGREVGVLKKNFGSLSDKQLKKVKTQLLAVNKATGNSINSMQAQKTALQGLRNMADVTGREFKELTRDIALLDQKMKQAAAGGGAGGLKSRLKGFAKGAGAIAAGGIFGGPEGAIGGAIGLSMGGPAGAAVGAAIGAQVGMVRQQIAGLAEYSASLALQRKALRLVINDTNQYNKSQKFLLTTSRELAIPQEVITRQFTSLTASVVGAGQSVADSEKVFQAIAAGIRGTGGNLEDMKAAMRATSQVFSKGKVSAEELRQQLGERLPGAFTLFADSMNKTPAELDKALEQGKVTLEDFMGFADLLFKKYGENAKILAQGPEAAGDRLTTATSELKDAIGKAITPIGALFQGTFSEIVVAITNSEGAMKAITHTLKGIGLAAFVSVEGVRFLIRTLVDLAKIQLAIVQLDFKKAIEIANKGLKDTSEQAKKNLQRFKDLYGIGADSDSIPSSRREDATGTGDGAEGGTGDGKDDKALGAIQIGAQKYFSTIKSFAEETGAAVAKAFQGMEDALVKFVMTGKLNFSDLTRSILADMARIAIRQAIMKPFTGFIEGLFSANGNAFAANGVVPYRKGGVVNSPTYFKYGGSQLGIMGEAGPEAVMPLKRGRGGKLGVIAQGGGAGNITVNVDASGSSVEGDGDGGRQLGEVIAAAIQSELIQQKRPGGILA
tara:strand:+ start:363 stop:2441 length:2079 start_codon:yes stop_codon:yes gene_type:complete